MQLRDIKTIYFVGIKGVAMTALAVYAKERGFTVLGSDVADKFPTDQLLSKNNIQLFQNFSSDHINSSIDLVIFTGAHNGSENVEVKAAQKLSISVMSHAQALGYFTQESQCIAVCGSHGKTTTSALISSLFMHGGFDPSFTIGCGGINDLGTSGHYGKGEQFVVEADEYVTDPHHDQTPRFLWLTPKTVIVTNIDFDHPDVYESLDDVKKVFAEFSQKIKNNGLLIINSDDHNSQFLIESSHVPVLTYGKGSDADYCYSIIHSEKGRTTFSISKKGEKVGEFKLSVPGEHNVANATAAIIACLHQRVSVEVIKEKLVLFTGTKRRFEKYYETEDLVVIDDYAHHPAEIAATISSARQWYPNFHITVVFQPHTYSRTKALMSEFSVSLKTADTVILPNIYASARESFDPNVSIEDLVKKIGSTAVFMPQKAHVLEYLGTHTQKPSVVLFMGAGDIYTWVPEFVRMLR